MTSDKNTALLLDRLKEGDGLRDLLTMGSYDDLEKKLYERYEKPFNRLKSGKMAYIFGAFRNGIKALGYCRKAGIEVAGFVDNDPAKQGTELSGIKIHSLDEVKDRGAVILISSGRHGVPIDGQLAELGFEYRLSFMASLFYLDPPYQAEGKFTGYLRDLFVNKDRYAALYLLLGDDRSRAVLNELISLRLTLDAGRAQRAADDLREEYFDGGLVRIGPEEVFIDGGAYDGDTAMRFIKRSGGDYRHIYLFEPEPAIYQKAVDNMKGLKNVTVVPKGLYSRDGDLFFSSTGDMDGAISDKGTKIEVVALDNFVRQPVTFIKLDVEGAEAEAIKGAEGHIRQSSPKLAVGAYHRSGDMWRLPMLISSMGPRYEFFLRHYSQIMDDTTLYAIPDDSMRGEK